MMRDVEGENGQGAFYKVSRVVDKSDLVGFFFLLLLLLLLLLLFLLFSFFPCLFFFFSRDGMGWV